MSFTIGEVKTIFSNLHVDKNKNRYSSGLAPHKPLLLLSLILLHKNNRANLSDISVDIYLKETWSDLWDCLNYSHPGPLFLPYYHLKSDGFWNIKFKEGVHTRQLKSLKQIDEFVDHVSMDESVIELIEDDSFRVQLINSLLNGGYFEKSEIEGLTKKIQEIDESFEYEKQLQKLVNTRFLKEPKIDFSGLPPSRDPAFRRLVLDAYDETCCICGMQLQNSSGISIIDAAHILPFSKFHNDDVRNGLSLCKLHHWLFDHGIISVDNYYKVNVSRKIEYEWPEKLVTAFEKEKIILPKEKKYYPSTIALTWHKTKIFD